MTQRPTSTPPEPSLLLHPSAGNDGSVREFNYDEAFSRNIGWVSEWEQHALRMAQTEERLSLLIENAEGR